MSVTTLDMPQPAPLPLVAEPGSPGEFLRHERRSVSLMVPFYNEESGVLPLKRRLVPVIAELTRDYDVEVVLVDDGSSDRTAEELEKHFSEGVGAEVRFVRHDYNRGIGAAMRSAFAVCRGDLVATLDCDCTYAPERIPDMIARLLEEDADVITGSPYHPEGTVRDVPRWRLALSKSASSFYSRLAPQHLYCYTSFFRVYRREWATAALFTSDGFLGVTEILIALAYGGADIIEFPIQLSSRVHGESKMKVVRVMTAHLRLMAIVVLFNVCARLFRRQRSRNAPEPLPEYVYKERIMADNMSALGTSAVLSRA